MVKLCRTQIVFSVALGLITSACSSSGHSPGIAEIPANQASPRPLGEHAMPFNLSHDPTEVRKLWTQKVVGIITDLNVSHDGSAILVATTPNPDVEGSGSKHLLARYDKSGKLLWRLELEGAVKSQALTGDGKLALVSTYDNQIFAINAVGKKLWTQEAMCRPLPVLQGRFLCYHDDDAESDVAFDVYTDAGKKVLGFPVTRDVLAMKVSEDRRNTALALTDGQVILLNSDFKSVWQKKVEGEVLDLAVSSGSEPRVSALFDLSEESKAVPGTSAQKLAVFDAKGKILAEGRPALHAEQVEFVPNASGLAVYGNSAKGQYLAFFEVPQDRAVLNSRKPAVLLERWRRTDALFADYSSSIIVTKSLVVLGFEDVAANARHSHLLSFDLRGDLKWNIPLVTEEGAYLYAHGFAPEASLIAVGTDDSLLSAFQLLEKHEN